MLGDAHADKPLWQRINYIHLFILTSVPLATLYAIFFVPLQWRTAAFAVFYYFFTGFGITAGYHRLFSHQAFKAHWTVRWALLLAGSGAVQGSLLWWARDHRAHHRYVDTALDPYAAPKGFFYSHIGWMLVKKDRRLLTASSTRMVQDLEKDWFIRAQAKYYGFFAIGMGALLPTLVCGLGWGDWSGGYFWAGLARLLFVHHSTFCVNSLAHWAGEQTFSDGHTARNSVITAIVTLGEGYHNFHHEFPNDYRNGIEWYQYDPTKWLINILSVFGLAEELVQFPKDAIEKCRVETMARAAHAKAAALDWGDAPSDLPEWDMARVKQECSENERSILVIGGFAVDATGFEDQHPGGADFIMGYKGRDATRAFAGDVHRHNDAA